VQRGNRRISDEAGKETVCLFNPLPFPPFRPVRFRPHGAGMTQPEQHIYTAEETKIIRARQAARSRIMGIVLVALCVLFFMITVVKIGVWG
jgi:hypothetical protein